MPYRLKTYKKKRNKYRCLHSHRNFFSLIRNGVYHSMFFFLLCILLISIYTYIRWSRFTLRSDIPGLSPHFLLGNLFQTGILTRGKQLTGALATLKQIYGDIFQFWMGPVRFIVLNDVDDVQHVFNNRHIYDQGDLFVEKVGVLFPDSILCTKGKKNFDIWCVKQFDFVVLFCFP